MTKNILLSLLMLFMSIGLLAQAAPVTQQEAQQAATKFLLSKQIAGNNIKPATLSVNKLKGSNQAAFYIFNVGDNQGFVVVAGDYPWLQRRGLLRRGKGSFEHEELAQRVC